MTEHPRLFRAEDVTRFTTLWTRAYPAVSAFIATAIGNATDTEDVLQRTASVAVTKFETFDARHGPFVAWAIGIARFEVLKYRRASRDAQERVLDHETIEHVAAGFIATADELDDRRHALTSCLQKMKGRARRIVEHRYRDGMATSAIASALRIKPGNVSVILNRAYKFLRDCIDSELTRTA